MGLSAERSKRMWIDVTGYDGIKEELTAVYITPMVTSLVVQ